MIDMKYSREYILRRAFDVFMSKGYDSASISVLQEELNMSRGAMYRYFKNKDELFKAVIDEYFFRVYLKVLINIEKDYTVLELIDAINRRQQLIISAFYRAGFTHTTFLNYTALMIQAAKHYPDFVYEFRDISKRLHNVWRKALAKSIEANEVRKDINIDIMCAIFNSASLKESSDDNVDSDELVSSVKKNIERKKEITLYLYDLIKI